jgi:hypothetical protein
MTETLSEQRDSSDRQTILPGRAKEVATPLLVGRSPLPGLRPNRAFPVRLYVLDHYRSAMDAHEYPPNTR